MTLLVISIMQYQYICSSLGTVVFTPGLEASQINAPNA